VWSALKASRFESARAPQRKGQMPTRPLLLALCTLVSACHLGGAGVSGVVVAPGDPVRSVVLQPIDGASIAIKCPDIKDGPGLRATADGQGRFQISIERRFNRACTIEVAKEGYESASILLGSVCPRHEDEPKSEYCGLLTIVVVQLRKTAAPAASAPPRT
jgi:hypothetical protein